MDTNSEKELREENFTEHIYKITGIYALNWIILFILLISTDFTIGEGIIILIICLPGSIGLHLFYYTSSEEEETNTWLFLISLLFLLFLFPAYIISTYILTQSLNEKLRNLQDREYKCVREEKMQKEIRERQIREKTHSERLTTLNKIISRSEKVRLNQMADLLQFDRSDLLRWIYELPEDYAIKINGDFVIFLDEDITDKIDDLLVEFERMEKEKIGKFNHRISG